MIRKIRRVVTIVMSLIVLAFALLATGTYVVSCVVKASLPPTATEAPWAVQTDSRIYYAQQYSVQNGMPTIRGFWVQDVKGRFQFHDAIMTFPKPAFGQVAVVRRTK